MARGNWMSVSIVVAEQRRLASSIPFRFYFRAHRARLKQYVCWLSIYKNMQSLSRCVHKCRYICKCGRHGLRAMITSTSFGSNAENTFMNNLFWNLFFRTLARINISKNKISRIVNVLLALQMNNNAVDWCIVFCKTRAEYIFTYMLGPRWIDGHDYYHTNMCIWIYYGYFRTSVRISSIRFRYRAEFIIIDCCARVGQDLKTKINRPKVQPAL